MGEWSFQSTTYIWETDVTPVYYSGAWILHIQNSNTFENPRLLNFECSEPLKNRTSTLDSKWSPWPFQIRTITIQNPNIIWYPNTFRIWTHTTIQNLNWFIIQAPNVYYFFQNSPRSCSLICNENRTGILQSPGSDSKRTRTQVHKNKNYPDLWWVCSGALDMPI